MAMGCDFDYQQYEFELTAGDIDFIFAVGCTYAVSAASKGDRFTPEYRVPQHLKKAASEVRVRIVDNQLSGGVPTSFADLAIDVVDQSHGVSVGEGLDEMLADSSVGGITLDIPGVLSGTATVTLTNTGGTGHDSIDPLTYEITILNEQSAVTGMYSGLVKVMDSYASGLNQSPLLSGNDGIMRVGPANNPLEGLFAISEFATYQLFEIEIGGIPNDPPVADLQPDPVNIYEGNSVNFNATASNDPDGTIMLYEFDYDWDGVELNFTADASNATGLVTSDAYLIQGDFTAGLRVTDNLGAIDYDSVPVTVTEYTGGCPNAPFAGVTYSSSFSFDDDYCLYTGNTHWAVWANQIIDIDIMSNGNAVVIYSDGVNSNPSNIFQGEIRIIAPTGGSYTVIATDYPGDFGMSVDVDSADCIVFVTSDLPHIIGPGGSDANARDYTLTEIVTSAHDFFTVVDPAIGVTSEIVVTVGTPIMAVDIDENDDVWVLDTDNAMHKYVKSSGYTELVAAGFDLDITTTGQFSGQVYDFVIDYYNEAFFILTDSSDRLDLWRIECDGVYNSLINGNVNPITDVLPATSYPTYDISAADITIDNLNASGVILSGAQDSQIVIAASIDENPVSDPYWYYTSVVARVDSELDQNVAYEGSPFITGGTCAAMNQRTNELWTMAGGVWGDGFTVRYYSPAGWQ